MMKKTEFMKTIRERWGKHGTVLIDFDRFSGTTSEIERMYYSCREEIEKMRGVCKSEILKGSWTWCIALYYTPCREFKNLNSYLKRWKLKELGLLTIRTDGVEGKRSSIDYSWRRCLAHNPSSCSDILKFLKDSRLGSAGRVDCTVIRHENCGGRYDSRGYDLECEWSGTYEYGLKITVYTKTGRIRSQEEFYE